MTGHQPDSHIGNLTIGARTTALDRVVMAACVAALAGFTVLALMDPAPLVASVGLSWPILLAGLWVLAIACAGVVFDKPMASLRLHSGQCLVTLRCAFLGRVETHCLPVDQIQRIWVEEIREAELAPYYQLQVTLKDFGTYSLAAGSMREPMASQCEQMSKALRNI